MMKTIFDGVPYGIYLPLPFNEFLSAVNAKTRGPKTKILKIDGDITNYSKRLKKLSIFVSCYIRGT